MKENIKKNTSEMEIIRFPLIKGLTPSLLNGTDRYAYALSDFIDAWDLKHWQENGGYQGSILYLYDLYENKVYIPFEKKFNTIYEMPLFYDNMIYFLQIDYDDQKINLYKMLPGEILEKVTELYIGEVDLYNIRLISKSVHIVSINEKFICYYPEVFEIKLESNESVACIDGDRIYINAWFEYGVENGEITNNYSYHEKILIKDKKGNLISEEVGSLTQFSDGKWRIS